jgi:hypothetical protein
MGAEQDEEEEEKESRISFFFFWRDAKSPLTMMNNFQFFEYLKDF